MNDIRKARQVIAEPRCLAAANGIPLQNHVLPRLAETEEVHAYGGAERIQTRLAGRTITGHAPFP